MRKNLDTIEFYGTFGTDTVEMNRETGVCRKSLTKMVSDDVRKGTAEVILSHLEEKNIEMYHEAVGKHQREIRMLYGKINEEWQAYWARDKLIKVYCDKYKISREETTSRLIKPIEAVKKALRK